MKIISILLLVCCVVLNIVTARIKSNSKRFPSPVKLKVVDGIIHHPTYGEYPKEVKFREGMTLYPGQSAAGEIHIINTRQT